LRISGINPAVFLAVLVLILSSMVLIAIPEAHALPCSFIVSSGTWENAANWSCGSVPAPGQNVIVPSGTVTISTPQSIQFLDIDSGATVNCNSCTLNITGDLTINSGGILNNNGGTISLADGELTNTGTFNNGGSFITHVAGDILNQAGGFILNKAGATITAGLDIFNDGTFINCGGTITAAGTIGGANPIQNGGSACLTTVVPEYPVGLPILAIFMVVGYGLIRRRTTTKRLN
jgi:hypothetical protein